MLLSTLRVLQLLLLPAALVTHYLARTNKSRYGIERRVIVVRGRRMRVAQLQW